MPPKKQLGQILLESGLIDEFQLKSALGYQKKWGGRLGKVLVENRFITEEGLVQAIHEQTGIPTVDVKTLQVPDYLIRLVPLEMASRHMLLPVRLENEEGKSAEVLYLAMSDPTNLDALDEVRFRTGKRTRPLLAAESDLDKAIRRVYLKEDAGADQFAPLDVSFNEVVVQGTLEQPPPAIRQESGVALASAAIDPFAVLESIDALPAGAAATQSAPASATAAAGDLPEIELVEEVADLMGVPAEAAPPDAAPVVPPLAAAKSEATPAPSSIQEILNRVGVQMSAAAAPAPPPAAPKQPEKIEQAPQTPPAPPVKEIVREIDDRLEHLLSRLESVQKDEELPQLMRPSHVVAALVRLLLRKELVSVEELLEELRQQ